MHWAFPAHAGMNSLDRKQISLQAPHSHVLPVRWFEFKFGHQVPALRRITMLGVVTRQPAAETRCVPVMNASPSHSTRRPT